MIKKLRFKFISITMGALILLLIIIFVSANLVMRNNNEQSTDRLLRSIIISGGIIPTPQSHENLGNQPNFKSSQGPQSPPVQILPPPEEMNQTEIFSAELNTDNEIITIHNDSSYSTDEIEEYVNLVLISNENTGKIDNVSYIFEETQNGKIIAFANQSIQNELLDELKYVSFIISIISIIILSIIVVILSKIVTKPIETAFEKQKRFVSDSGHELKTPLSILSANADMLEMEQGENQWLTQIKEQAVRMSKLIHELLTLARTEDMSASIQFNEFDLSQTILNTALPLEMLAFDQKKEFEFDIEENVIYKGNEKRISEMIEALMDNAIKYADEDSKIMLKLQQKGNRRIIEIGNKGRGIKEEDKKQLFEKFYRTDGSRARETGGYGLGLSIVKNIVDIHKGKIEIDTKSKDYIIFRIILY